MHTDWARQARAVDTPDQAAEFVRRAILADQGREVLASPQWKTHARHLVEPGAPGPLHLVDGDVLDGCSRCMVTPRWLVVPMTVDGEVPPSSGMVRRVPSGGGRGRQLRVAWTADGADGPLTVVRIGVALSAVVGDVVATISMDFAHTVVPGDSIEATLPVRPHAQVVWSAVGSGVMVAPVGTPAPS